MYYSTIIHRSDFLVNRAVSCVSGPVLLYPRHGNLMWFGSAMENHYISAIGYHCTGSGLPILPGAHVHATIQAFPAPGPDAVLREKTYLGLRQDLGEPVLISGIVAHDVIDVATAHCVPDPTKTPGVPQHHAAVDPAPSRSPQSPIIAYGPERCSLEIPQPVEITQYHHV